MRSDLPKLVCFNIGNAVEDLCELYPKLTDRDIDSITEQVLYSFIDQNTLVRIGDVPYLEIERLPDSYGIVRDITECDTLQAAFRRYHETIRMILLLFGMEQIFMDEARGYIYDRFIANRTKLVLRGL